MQLKVLPVLKLKLVVMLVITVLALMLMLMLNAGDWNAAGATDTADDAEGTADGAEDGRNRACCRDAAALDRTEFPVRTEVLGDIREDG